MRRVAIGYVASGYATDTQDLKGIQIASDGLLRAIARHAGLAEFCALVPSGADGARFRALVATANPTLPTQWLHNTQVARLAEIGTLLVPGPDLPQFGWARQKIGAASYSLCGITHTLATTRVQAALAGYAAGPVMPWDALICTSHAAHAAVCHILDRQEDWLRARLGPMQPPRPQLPVIPLGIETAAFAPDPAARAAWRQRLGLTDTDVVALFVGRLSFHGKAHPIPLFQALQLAALAAGQLASVAAGQLAASAAGGRLRLVMAGWFANAATERAFRQAAAAFCPDVPALFVDARPLAARHAIWSLADLFVSPSDNIQESFGLTPVEAMAAGLPVVVSDWNGYRDTVRDGVDGFRVATVAAPPGHASVLADAHAEERLDYDPFIGLVAQSVAVDVRGMATAIARLVGDASLRRRMGRAGRRRAAAFDWQAIIPRHVALWADLAARRQQHAARQHAARPGAARLWQLRPPAWPEPFTAFAGHPTGWLHPEWLATPTGRPAGEIERLLASALLQFPGAEAHGAIQPGPRVLRTVLAAAEGGSIGRLLATQPDRQSAMHALLWLAKFDLLRLTPPG